LPAFPLDPLTLALLVLAAFVAGFVDSIAGGGGLITLPALLIAGIPPVEAVATNKLQSSFGTAMSSYRYWKAGLVEPGNIIQAIIATAIGAALGGYALRLIDPSLLQRGIPFLLIGIAIYFAFGPKASDVDSHARLTPLAFACGIAAPIGFYDGMFGPGTGSFFAVGFVTMAGFGLLKATANTKILNFVSNIAGLAVFIWSGQVIYVVGLTMAIGQTAGAYVGSHTAITHGAKLIRPLIVVVSCAIALRLLLKG
jgi:uncharacterized protein